MELREEILKRNNGCPALKGEVGFLLVSFEKGKYQ
jgi:hypothetical protein